MRSNVCMYACVHSPTADFFVNYNARGSHCTLSATAQSYLPSWITFKFYDYSCNIK